MTTMRRDDMADHQTSPTNQTRVAATPSDRRHTAAGARPQAPQVTVETGAVGAVTPGELRVVAMCTAWQAAGDGDGGGTDADPPGTP
jgi:hypothetical protein